MLRKILLSTKTSELVNYIKRQYDNITLSYCQKLIELNLMLKTKADFQVTDRLTNLTKFVNPLFQLHPPFATQLLNELGYRV